MDTNFIFSNYTQFTGVLVKGAPAYLQDNINPRKGLSNDTAVTLHFLVLDPNEDVTRVMCDIMNPQSDDTFDSRLIFYMYWWKVSNADPNDFINLSVAANEVIIYPYRWAVGVKDTALVFLLENPWF